MSARDVLLASALEYAARGWAVFPILPDLGQCPTAIKPSTTMAKLSPSGWKQWATTDRARVARVWTRHPWGIGIACGLSHLIVIDSEPNSQGDLPGESALHHLAHPHGGLPTTWTVSTAVGGISRYYQFDPAAPIPANALGAHLKIRSTSHYTIAPPTTTNVGTWYLLQNHPPAPLPTWLAETLCRVSV